MLMNSFDLYVPCILINDEFPGVHNISDTHTFRFSIDSQHCGCLFCTNKKEKIVQINFIQCKTGLF